VLQALQAGACDVLVGVNLLREGIDLPQVSLVVVLDADKEVSRVYICIYSVYTHDIFIYICIYMYMYVCMYIYNKKKYVYIYIYVHIYMYIYIYM